MRKVTVPVDMSSEQKTILGILSKRQLTYSIVAGVLIYFYGPFFFRMASSFYVGVAFFILSSLPTAVFTIVLAFVKKEKVGMYFDRYLLTKMGYKNEIGLWRKGTHAKEWMVKHK
ncbi:PrgI family protein [Priestia koreensis]|uniref:PrgI family protein n=1 Tax=Priestia koreensis TaxID=284581 RepID=UPI00345AD8E3